MALPTKTIKLFKKMLSVDQLSHKGLMMNLTPPQQLNPKEKKLLADMAATKRVVSGMLAHIRMPPLQEPQKPIKPLRRMTMKRASRGLFGGEHIIFGDTISKKGANRTRRSWKPNVQNKRFYSILLNRFIPFKATVRVISLVDKHGCIDDYLLETPSHELQSDVGEFWKEKLKTRFHELKAERCPYDVYDLLEKPEKKDKLIASDDAKQNTVKKTSVKKTRNHQRPNKKRIVNAAKSGKKRK